MASVFKLLFAFLLIVPLSAEDFYVSQSGSGTQSGADPSNTQTIAWLNTSGNWGVGANKVSAGDTVFLSGTFTTVLTIQGSGSAGNLITITFLTGANFTKPFWPSTGAIDLNGKSFITIDGGTNGKIENTANGSGVATNGSKGINGTVYNAVIKNMIITNIYKKTIGNLDDSREGYPITVSGSEITVTNCFLSDGDGGLVYSGTETTQSNIFFRGNTLRNLNHSIVIGIGDSDSYLTNLVIEANDLDHWDVWDCPGDTQIHLDGIIVLNNSFDPTSIIAGFKIINNRFGQYVGTRTTAGIFIDLANPQAQIQRLLIYNNLFLCQAGNSWGNGFISAEGTECWVINNTIIGSSSNGFWGGSIQLHGTNAFAYNNLVQYGSGISMGEFTTETSPPLTDGNDASGTNQLRATTYLGGVWSDYNVWYGPPNSFQLVLSKTNSGNIWLSGIFNTFAGWKSWIDNRYGWSEPFYNQLHCDPNSSTNLPTFATGYVPSSSDTVAKGAGTNLTAVLVSFDVPTTDLLGRARPASGNWTIGAYEADGGGGGGGSTGAAVSNIAVTGIKFE